SSPCSRLYHSVLFFYSHTNHLDLHSFPTRRSSDLCKRLVICAQEPDNLQKTLTMLIEERYKDEDTGSGGVTHFRNLSYLIQPVRSEEHTSELQSRFDLVCRLLLEKKKHNTNNLLIN